VQEDAGDTPVLGFIGIIKKQMSLRRHFLNPVLIKQATPQPINLKRKVKSSVPKQKVLMEDGGVYSPISSEEGNSERQSKE